MIYTNNHDRKKVARFAAQTSAPGTAAPGAASPDEVEVPSAASSVGVGVVVPSSATPRVRVPAGVMIRGVVFGGGLLSHTDARSETTRDLY